MKFILLLRDEEKFLRLSPEEQQAVVARYSAWAKKLREEGRFLDGDGLDPGGAVLRVTDQGVVVTDGPFAETRELIGGYVAITADSVEEAKEIAKECPTLSYGGVVELRWVMDYS
jgi:hypothetical protein